ncbi:MAG: hypothetical protein AB8G23_00740 [Myxococcota bacterium]
MAKPNVEIPVLDPSEAPRARRWDALVLGSGISALIAAARIGAAGQRVLMVEEDKRLTLPPALKEPFFLGGLRDEGALDACLRALAVPLIDRRRIATERLAYQVASDPYRLDVGQPAVTADELVAWGLAKPDEAQRLVHAIIDASETEKGMLLQSPFVRTGRRVPAMGSGRRGLPHGLVPAGSALERVSEAQIRALSNLGNAAPGPEAEARLLGLGLAGGVGFASEPPWLVDLLRKRVTALYGDIRTLPGDFDLVTVSGQPGIRIGRTGEIWLGRALILGVPPASLRDAYRADGDDPTRPAPGLVCRDLPRAYRGVFLFRIPTAYLPDGMGARVILPGRAKNEPTAFLTAFPSQTHPHSIDLVVRAVLNLRDPAQIPTEMKRVRALIADRLRALMPFSGDELRAVEVEMPHWDSDDGWLEDPESGVGWPSDVDLRLSSRPPIYHLDRSAVAGLGLEGDLLLGWRGGDAIAAELA